MCANILLMFYWLYVSIAVVLTFWKKIAKVPNKEDVTELPLTLCADGSTFSWITCVIDRYVLSLSQVLRSMFVQFIYTRLFIHGNTQYSLSYISLSS